MRRLIVLFALGLHSLLGEGTQFVFMGDAGHGDPPQYEVAKGMQTYCAAKKCEFALLLGDNFYPSGVKTTTDSQWKTAFEVPYGPLKLLFRVALGNHDHAGNIDAQIDYTKISAIWSMPSRYYTFSQGNTQFFVIDSTKWDGVQREWLKKELGQSQARWKVVAGHHPIYSYGQHGHTPELVRELRPILLGKADFYLCGHDHDKQILKDSEDSALFYVVSGGGSETRAVQGGLLSLYHASSIGFSSLHLDTDTAVLGMHSSGGQLDYERKFQHRK
ncbi:MAG: metallophosphoesterase [Deltaproteobacteria bacterium]|nr:metallophosphoesterase [Deltaproteobacteria bacterium]MBI3293457.1 metallophosphoesterase [Deltaproteobacteria bacterium]